MVSPWTESGMLKMTNLRKSLGFLQQVQGGKGPLTLHLQVFPSPGALPAGSWQSDPSQGQQWEEQPSARMEGLRSPLGVSMISSWNHHSSKSGGNRPLCNLLEEWWSQAGQRTSYGSPCKTNTKLSCLLCSGTSELIYLDSIAPGELEARGDEKIL